MEDDVKGSIEAMKGCFRDLCDKHVPLKKLIFTKKLAGNYKNPKSQIHWNVNEAIKKAKSKEPHQIGDRIPYVIVRRSVKNLSEKGLDPEAFLGGSEKMCYEHYIENLENPLKKLFGVFEDKEKTNVDQLLKKWKGIASGVGKKSVLAFFKRKKQILNGNENKKRKH